MSIYTVVENEGFNLLCDEYEQLDALRYNLTCQHYKNDLYWSYITDTETFSQVSEEKECYRDETIKSEPIVIKVNGECIKYKIVKLREI